MARQWQLQEAKQRFSELVRAVLSEGPQVVTRHGEEVAVVIDVAEYHRLLGAQEASDDFKTYLRSMPELDEVVAARRRDRGRVVELAPES